VRAVFESNLRCRHIKIVAKQGLQGGSRDGVGDPVLFEMKAVGPVSFVDGEDRAAAGHSLERLVQPGQPNVYLVHDQIHTAARTVPISDRISINTRRHYLIVA